MPHTKTPGGQQASEKFQKQQAQQQGLGAENAAGHTEGHAPGEAPVASDSGSSYVGVRAGDNLPGEKGISGKTVDTALNTQNSGNTKQ
ncbi:hypothetical protein AMS68_005409 [Peltaster fructicola]|uniref:Uncharacterized protein n=1 Tax=Peltaster fructicola TaxID=286661 RepID=A0A6H0XYP1_9PEZI|nr:hypothetical protein AMS68_005409 [Peltaster fructicola]